MFWNQSKSEEIDWESEEMKVIVQRVQQLISQNAVMIFSKSYCPYCHRAKSVFKDRNTSFEALELDQDPQGDLIQKYLFKLTNQRTVPNIFIHGQHIGGCDDLLRLGEDRLDQLLNKSANL
jgi:glutaredoxin 3